MTLSAFGWSLQPNRSDFRRYLCGRELRSGTIAAFGSEAGQPLVAGAQAHACGIADLLHGPFLFDYSIGQMAPTCARQLRMLIDA